jgi:glyoxylase-like metal-dependent hydrolase (beta-lactamase superfamily II)
VEAPGWIPELGLGFWELGSMRNFVYLLADSTTREALVVDPQKDLEPLLKTIEREQLTLTKILLTHSHFDHVAGVPGLLARFPDVKVLVGTKDRWRLRQTPDASIETIEGGERLDHCPMTELGRTTIHHLKAPGHSAGALVSFFRKGEQPFAFTGDTLFVRDCGRTDLETGSARELFETIQRVRQELPPQTILLCGHHYAGQITTVLAAENDESGPFLCRSLSEFEALP